jgi:chromate transporter
MSNEPTLSPHASDPRVTLRDIFWHFLKQGWLGFGGPVGQIGLLHLQLVERKKWLTEEEFVRGSRPSRC